MKFLFWLIVGFIAVSWFLRGQKKNNSASSGRAAASARPDGQPEVIRACAHCGLHVPVSEAVHYLGMTFCSEDHRRLKFPG